MKPLSVRQAEVVERVARGLPDKRIAADLSISIFTVRRHVQDAAERLPGRGTPRHKLTLWFFNIVDEEKAG